MEYDNFCDELDDEGSWVCDECDREFEYGWDEALGGTINGPAVVLCPDGASEPLYLCDDCISIDFDPCDPHCHLPGDSDGGGLTMTFFSF